MLGNVQVDVFETLKVSIEKIKVRNFNGIVV
jgi:hypothetical protein